MARSKIKHVTYELKVTVQLPAGNTNQHDLLHNIRQILFEENIRFEDQKPKVTVISSKTQYLDL